ncbi:hypothetical protein RFI_25492 [Reticulomyxa filosa]|uniref:Uncharacterized protein n=1 Tax=Reticulomyxa filosa TaxID=46433 RepID=X6MD18_RETFI|nr:hypothetical protein RFI_25492 [Reticulomyxa filosa]|eukprot:ETO11883.1 hypothetical protein RFI_25492 [Reticulomyxa filosa]
MQKIWGKRKESDTSGVVFPKPRNSNIAKPTIPKKDNPEQKERSRKNSSESQRNEINNTILTNKGNAGGKLLATSSNSKHTEKQPNFQNVSFSPKREPKIIPFVGDKVRLKNKMEGKVTHIGFKQKRDGVWVRLEVTQNGKIDKVISKESAVWVTVLSIEKIVQCMFQMCTRWAHIQNSITISKKISLYFFFSPPPPNLFVSPTKQKKKKTTAEND